VYVSWSSSSIYGDDSGNRIFVLYWRCSLIRVSVIRGSTVFIMECLILIKILADISSFLRYDTMSLRLYSTPPPPRLRARLLFFDHVTQKMTALHSFEMSINSQPESLHTPMSLPHISHTILAVFVKETRGSP
jgi:hypothetical protein